MVRLLKKFIPKPLFRLIQPIYHYVLAGLGAIIFRFPSRKIKIVGITGTKGKTSVAEIINCILEQAGYKTALAGTLRFKIDKQSRPNLYKMTMPGRFFMQSFLRKALEKKCDWVILEMTSEGAKQWRHKWIDLDAFVFTNIAPEHIESHGSFENYIGAKIKIAKNLKNSSKKETVMVINKDDERHKDFLKIKAEKTFLYGLEDAGVYKIEDQGISFTYNKENFHSKLRGKFNLYNILAALTFSRAIDIETKDMKLAISKLTEIKGRAELVNVKNETDKQQNFEVVVDYAHTKESLQAIYEAFGRKKKICVLGNTGGGRDKWKRKEMGEIADKYCSEIILTNEDPYNENPEKIIKDVLEGIKNKPHSIIMDRREAIREALRRALLAQDSNQNVTVLITGKGTDPYIMGPNETKTSWSDSEVVREELKKILI